MDSLRIFIKKIFIYLISKGYVGLSYLIPIKRNYFAFYPIHDLTKLSGNLRALIIYLKEHHEDIELVVITNNKEVKNEAKRLEIKSSSTFFGFTWTLLRTKFVFIDSNWFPYLLSPKLAVIQLWHGVGFKNIALLDDNLTDENEKNKFLAYYSQYSLLISSSEVDFKKKKESFHSPHIAITGSPRNDVFFSSYSYFEEIKKKYQLESYSKIITYAPTFRDFKTKNPFSIEFWESLQEHLKKTNQLFVVKKHPMDQHLKVPIDCPNIKDLSEVVSDTQELLLITDILISDYSSISTDFALTGRPIITYAYDLEAYKNNCRSMYYDLYEILPRPFVYTEGELIEKIKNTEWTKDKYYIEEYDKFKEIFHKYIDGDSSRRVMNEVQKLKTRVNL